MNGIAGAPDIPTAAEQGFPGVTNVGTIGIAAPAKAPKAIVEQIAHATRTALSDKLYQQRLIESDQLRAEHEAGARTDLPTNANPDYPTAKNQ